MARKSRQDYLDTIDGWFRALQLSLAVDEPVVALTLVMKTWQLPWASDLARRFDCELVRNLRDHRAEEKCTLLGALYDRAAVGQPDPIDFLMDFLKKLPTRKLKLFADLMKLVPLPPSPTFAKLGPDHFDLFRRVTVLEPNLGVSSACAVVASEGKGSEVESVRRQYYRVKDAIGPALETALCSAFRG